MQYKSKKAIARSKCRICKKPYVVSEEHSNIDFCKCCEAKISHWYDGRVINKDV